MLGAQKHGEGPGDFKAKWRTLGTSHILVWEGDGAILRRRKSLDGVMLHDGITVGITVVNRRKRHRISHEHC